MASEFWKGEYNGEVLGGKKVYSRVTDGREILHSGDFVLMLSSGENSKPHVIRIIVMFEDSTGPTMIFQWYYRPEEVQEAIESIELHPKELLCSHSIEEYSMSSIIVGKTRVFHASEVKSWNELQANDWYFYQRRIVIEGGECLELTAPDNEAPFRLASLMASTKSLLLSEPAAAAAAAVMDSRAIAQLQQLHQQQLQQQQQLLNKLQQQAASSTTTSSSISTAAATKVSPVTTSTKSQQQQQQYQQQQQPSASSNIKSAAKSSPNKKSQSANAYGYAKRIAHKQETATTSNTKQPTTTSMMFVPPSVLNQQQQQQQQKKPVILATPVVSTIQVKTARQSIFTDTMDTLLRKYPTALPPSSSSPIWPCISWINPTDLDIIKEHLLTAADNLYPKAEPNVANALRKEFQSNCPAMHHHIAYIRDLLVQSLEKKTVPDSKMKALNEVRDFLVKSGTKSVLDRVVRPKDLWSSSTELKSIRRRLRSIPGMFKDDKEIQTCAKNVRLAARFLLLHMLMVQEFEKGGGFAVKFDPDELHRGAEADEEDPNQPDPFDNNLDARREEILDVPVMKSSDDFPKPPRIRKAVSSAGPGSLPIDSHLPLIGERLLKHNIICVTAPTGTGKSLGIPKYLGETMGLRVIVCIPTIVAVRSLYHTQKKMTNLPVGFAANSIVRYNSSSRIIYCTTGHLKESLLRNEVDADVIMVDEAHDRSVNTYLVISLVHHHRNTMLQSKLKPPMLIVSSATLETPYISRRFPGIHAVDLTPTRPHPIQEVYHLEGPEYAALKIEPNKEGFIDPRLIYQAKTMPTIVSTIVLKYHKLRAIDDVFLVFCPGSDMVEDIIEELWKYNELENTVVLPAYSSLTQEDLDAVFDPPPQGVRKIVVATNIAESSCTIEDVGLVIDSMMEKVVVTNSCGAEELQLQWCTRSSADQRKGRTGRMRPGICVRVCSLAMYESLSQYGDQEICRVPIHGPVLSIGKARLDPAKLLVDVSKSKINACVKELKELGLVEIYKEEEGEAEKEEEAEKKSNAAMQQEEWMKVQPHSHHHRLLMQYQHQHQHLEHNAEVPWCVTVAGLFCERIPVAIRNSAAIERAARTDQGLVETLVAVAVIESSQGTFFYVPRRGKDMTQAQYKDVVDKLRKEKWSKFKKENDVETLVAVLGEAAECKNYHERKEWAGEYSLNNKKVVAAFALFKRLCALNGINSMEVDIGALDMKLALGNLEEFNWCFRLSRRLNVNKYGYVTKMMDMNKGLSMHGNSKIWKVAAARSFCNDGNSLGRNERLVPLIRFVTHSLDSGEFCQVGCVFKAVNHQEADDEDESEDEEDVRRRVDLILRGMLFDGYLYDSDDDDDDEDDDDDDSDNDEDDDDNDDEDDDDDDEDDN